ncbi:MAG: PfkB family carbohydrate kinase [Gemmataceae bacterium]
MNRSSSLGGVNPPPSIVGIGQVTLDVQAWGPPPYPLLAGGTVVNVLARLARWGWQTHLIARLGTDSAGEVLLADLLRAGVGCALITRDPQVKTAVMVQQSIGIEPRFSPHCPQCAADLPDVADPPLPTALPEPPQVFFFDRDSPTALQLAEMYRSAGSLIVYEPNYVGPEVPLERCLSLTHILKCSAVAVPGLAERASQVQVPLVIETLGAQGLRWRERGGIWQTLAAPTRLQVCDTAGCGDALTACLLEGWQRGLERRTALQQAMELAASVAQYPGPRGDLLTSDPPASGPSALFCCGCRTSRKIGLV